MAAKREKLIPRLILFTTAQNAWLIRSARPPIVTIASIVRGAVDLARAPKKARRR